MFFIEERVSLSAGRFLIVPSVFQYQHEKLVTGNQSIFFQENFNVKKLLVHFSTENREE